MATIGRSRSQMALLLLALLGVGVSIYLTIEHYQGVTPACVSGGLINCERVLTSSYSVIPGTTIPISLPGLLWFAVSAVLAFTAWRVWPERRSVRMAEMVWAALGLLTVLYLVYVEIVVLRAVCLWCTSLHILILIMFLLTVLLQGQGSDVAEDAEEDEVTTPASVSE